MTKLYKISEVFYSLQGEGVRAGLANVFVRFHGCNLNCKRSTAGFDCDTNYSSYVEMTALEVSKEALSVVGDNCNWILLTGGEPGLQVDSLLLNNLRASGFVRIAIESNGSVALPPGFDWITISPKRHGPVQQSFADEVKCVISDGDPLPNPVCRAANYLLSPAYEGNRLSRKNLKHCIKLCLENPKWRLSVQQHKYWKIR